jgi:hypothetical protein
LLHGQRALALHVAEHGVHPDFDGFHQAIKRLEAKLYALEAQAGGNWPSRPARRSPPRAGRAPTSSAAWARRSRTSRPSSRPSWRPAAAGPCLPSSSCRGRRARPSRPRRARAPCGSSRPSV